MFGPPGQAQTFSVAVRSFPTPATFDWPDEFTEVGGTRVDDEVTVVNVTAMINNAASHIVPVRNTPNGLSSQITIRLKVRGNFYVHVLIGPLFNRTYMYNCKSYTL